MIPGSGLERVACPIGQAADWHFSGIVRNLWNCSPTWGWVLDVYRNRAYSEENLLAVPKIVPESEYDP
jgi:hypothetical protein